MVQNAARPGYVGVKVGHHQQSPLPYRRVLIEQEAIHRPHPLPDECPTTFAQARVWFFSPCRRVAEGKLDEEIDDSRPRHARQLAL
jgi:hypothetical protein